MVVTELNLEAKGITLSVLALSSRFDGPAGYAVATQLAYSFSTRSVESF